MEVEFETPTMLEILIRQGDRKGAMALYRKLRSKNPNDNLLSFNLKERLFSLSTSKLPGGENEVLRVLENWLNALQKS